MKDFKIRIVTVNVVDVTNHGHVAVLDPIQFRRIVNNLI